LVAVNYNSLNCLDDRIVKNLTGVLLEDETGSDINDQYEAELNMPSGVSCPTFCRTLGSGACKCEDLSKMDVRAQFQAIFDNSKLAQIGNLSSLANWKFW
jgi:hypothetical protein